MLPGQPKGDLYHVGAGIRVMIKRNTVKAATAAVFIQKNEEGSMERLKCISIILCLIGGFLLAGCAAMQEQLIPDVLKSKEQIKLEQAKGDLKQARCRYDKITGASDSSCDFTGPPAPLPFTITTPSSPLAYTVGKPYSYQLQTSGGTAPVKFRLAENQSLPLSLTLNSNGLLSGTVAKAGPAGNFTVVATDSSQEPKETTATFTITAKPFAITKPSSPLAYTVGKPYSYQLQTSGGTEPVKFEELKGPPLPEGLTLSSKGLLSGTVKTAESVRNFTVEAKEGPPESRKATLALAIAESVDKASENKKSTTAIKVCMDYNTSPGSVIITPSAAAAGTAAAGTVCIEYNSSPGNLVITLPSAAATKKTEASGKNGESSKTPAVKTSDGSKTANTGTSSGSPPAKVATAVTTSEDTSKSSEKTTVCDTQGTVSEEAVERRRQTLKERQAYVEVLKSELAVLLASLEKTSKDAGFFDVGLKGAGIGSGIAAAALTAASAAANAPWTAGLGVFTTGALALQNEATGIGFSTAIAEQKLDILKGNADTASSALAASSSWVYLDECAESATPACWQTLMKDLGDKIGKFESVVRYTKFGIKLTAKSE
jgi:hypothetical protein